MTLLDPVLLQQAIVVLRRGGIVAAATETLIALLADASQFTSVEAVFMLKARPVNLPVALLVPNVRTAKTLIHMSPAALRLADTYWPGPLTLVGEVQHAMHPGLSSEGGMGVRVPGESAAAQILDEWSGPLTATSANRSGEPAVANTNALSPEFAAQIRKTGLIIPSSGLGGAASTLVDVRKGIRVLRRGAITLTARETGESLD